MSDRTLTTLSGHPIYIQIGDELGDSSETPPERREEARAALELLLSGWKRAAMEAVRVTPQHRQVIAQTVERARATFEHHSTPHNLLVTLVADAFLLP